MESWSFSLTASVAVHTHNKKTVQNQLVWDFCRNTAGYYLHPVNFCLKFLYCPLSHLCIDLIFWILLIVIFFLNDCKSSPRHFWISPWHPWSLPQDLLLSFHSHRLQSWVVHFFAILKSLQSNQLTLIWKTFHGLVHPSQLGLQHGNLKIFKLLQRNNRCCVNALHCWQDGAGCWQ